jgi:cold shock CspA family protein
MKGEVIKWFDDKGYGFVTGTDDESYFLHISQMKEEVQPKVGDTVKFEGVSTDRGKQAQQVIIL